MNRRLRIGLISVAILGLALLAATRPPRAEAQKSRDEGAWEYKVAVFSYNPGERMTDEQRAAFYEKTLNEQARQGWEAVGHGDEPRHGPDRRRGRDHPRHDLVRRLSTAQAVTVLNNP